MSRSKFLIAACCFGAGVFGQVSAQTCASPVAIHSNIAVTGDTCTASNLLPTYGGSPSPQNEVVYSFVAMNANASLAVMETGGFVGSGVRLFLLPSCTSSTDPIAFGLQGTPMQVSGLNNGQTYYVVATADGTSPSSSCGQYTLTQTGPLPATLQQYSIE